MLTIIGSRYDETKPMPKRGAIHDLFAIKVYIDGVLQEERIYSQQQKLQFDVHHPQVEIGFQRFGKTIEIHSIDMNESDVYYYGVVHIWPVLLISLVIVLIGFFLSFWFLMLVGVAMFIMMFIKDIQKTAPIVALGKSKEEVPQIVGARVGEHYTYWKKNKKK